MTGRPATWHGTWTRAKCPYPQGAIVMLRSGEVFISSADENIDGPPSRLELRTGTRPSGWVPLGRVGALITRTVPHRWHPQELQYPVGQVLSGSQGPSMSEPALVCADCWKDADYRNAFLPANHLYVIREMP